MKKKLMLLMAVLVLGLTGCGKKEEVKTLICTQLDGDENMKLDLTYELTAKKGGNLKELKRNYKYTVSDEFADYLDSIASNLQKELDELKADGVEVNYNKANKEFTATVLVNVAKTSKETKDKLNYGQIETLDKAETYLNMQGMTCKEKEA